MPRFEQFLNCGERYSLHQKSKFNPNFAKTTFWIFNKRSHDPPQAVLITLTSFDELRIYCFQHFQDKSIHLIKVQNQTQILENQQMDLDS